MSHPIFLCLLSPLTTARYLTATLLKEVPVDLGKLSWCMTNVAVVPLDSYSQVTTLSLKWGGGLSLYIQLLSGERVRHKTMTIVAESSVFEPFVCKLEQQRFWLSMTTIYYLVNTMPF